MNFFLIYNIGHSICILWDQIRREKGLGDMSKKKKVEKYLKKNFFENFFLVKYKKVKWF